MSITSYIYNDAEKEEQRLMRLNEIYNSYTQDQLGKLLKPGMKVLEIGPGVGIFAQWLAKTITPHGQYIGLDQSEEQIRIANSLIKDMQLNNITYIHGKVEEISEIPAINNQKFDLIYCRWVLAHLPPKIVSSIIKSLFHLTSPNGHLVIEEGDVSKIKCVAATNHESIISNDAFNQMYELTFKMESEFNIDFKIGDKIQHMIRAITNEPTVQTITYQPILETTRNKEIPALVIPSIRAEIVKRKLIDKIKLDELEAGLYRLANNENVHIKYVENTITVIKRSAI